MKENKNYTLLVIGSGAAGMMGAITAASMGKSVLLLEKLPKLGAKLKATGGGKCNLTNTLHEEDFMAHFGRNGRFMTTALQALNQQALRDFFTNIGVESHSPDGFRVFPITHNATTILSALEEEMIRLGVDVLCNSPADTIYHDNHQITGIGIEETVYHTANVIIATGGLGYPSLGAQGDGYKLSRALGHKTTALFPAMTPLKTNHLL